MTTPTNRIAEDARLIAATLRGDELAFQKLVVHYQGSVYACTQAITRNPADAADAAQEAFIRLHRNLDQFDARRPLKPYLMRIAANCSKTLLSKKSRYVEELDQNQMAAASDVNPAARILKGERKEVVRELIKALPKTLREVTSLFYLAECSCRDVAEALEMTETAVKVALHRARKRLHRDLTAWRAT